MGGKGERGKTRLLRVRSHSIGHRLTNPFSNKAKDGVVLLEERSLDGGLLVAGDDLPNPVEGEKEPRESAESIISPAQGRESIGYLLRKLGEVEEDVDDNAEHAHGEVNVLDGRFREGCHRQL
jgi:hypothetical protein